MKGNEVSKSEMDFEFRFKLEFRKGNEYGI
jgi:hypothetical protein